MPSILTSDQGRNGQSDFGRVQCEAGCCPESMGLVNASANINVVDIQRNNVFSSQGCPIDSTSNVVLCSSQAGSANLATRSYSEPQSVIMTAGGSSLQQVSGDCQKKLSTWMQPQRERTHSGVSTAKLIAYTSADKVDLTTLGIFLEIHTVGDREASLLAPRVSSVAHTMTPDGNSGSWKMRKQHHRMT